MLVVVPDRMHWVESTRVSLRRRARCSVASSRETGSIAQRFVHTDVEAAEAALEHEERDTRTQLLAELRELSTRLQRLERIVREL